MLAAALVSARGLPNLLPVPCRMLRFSSAHSVLVSLLNGREFDLNRTLSNIPGISPSLPRFLRVDPVLLQKPQISCVYDDSVPLNKTRIACVCTILHERFRDFRFGVTSTQIRF